MSDSTLIALNTIAAGVLGLTFWISSSWVIAKEDVGAGSAIIAALGLLATVSLLGLPETIIRHWAHKRFRLRFIQKALIGSAVIAGLLFAGFSAWLSFNNQGSVSPITLSASALFLIGSLSTSISNAGLLSLSLPKLQLVVTLVSGLAKIAVLFGINGKTLESILISVAVGSVVSASVSLALLVTKQKKGVIPYKLQTWSGSEIRKFAISNWISGSVSLIPLSLATFILFDRAGGAASAYAAIPLALLTALNLPAGSISRAVFVNGSRNNSRNLNLILRAAGIASILNLCIVLAVFMFGSHFYLIIKPEYAHEGLLILNWLTISCLVAVPNYLIDTYFNLKHRYIEYSICNIGGTLLQVVAIFAFAVSPETLGKSWLLGQVGYLLVAGATLMCYLLRKYRSKSQDASEAIF